MIPVGYYANGEIGPVVQVDKYAQSIILAGGKAKVQAFTGPLYYIMILFACDVIVIIIMIIMITVYSLFITY